MPRFRKLRDGCDWLWTDVMNAEEMIESFAGTIHNDQAKPFVAGGPFPAVPVETLVAEMKVYRYHEDHRLGGQVSRLEHTAGRHFWVAAREEGT